MKINSARCIGCSQCVPYCPVGAISVEDQVASIEEEICLECRICFRSRVCPQDAFINEEDLPWPRSLRASFSDVLSPHKGTGVLGRGTEEMKTNDVTNRIQPGSVGIAIEMGRPGVGTTFMDVQTVAQAMARLPIRFEPANPVTNIMADAQTGTLLDEVLDERALSAIIEFETKMEHLPEVVRMIREVEKKIATVFSVALSARADERTGEIPFEEILKEAGMPCRPNGKTNVGLGRKLF